MSYIHCPKCRAILGERVGEHIRCKHSGRIITIIGGTVAITCHKSGCGAVIVVQAGAPTYAGMEKVLK